MTAKPAPSEQRPIPVVLRQRWVLTLPTGAEYDAGYSYHFNADDRVLFIAEALSTSERQADAGREEPLGEAELFQTTLVHLARIRETPHGLRSR